MFWVLLLNIIVKPFWILGIEVGVQNAVGAEMYGLYFSIFNISYIFNILLDLGITNFNTRNTARHPVLINKYLPNILTTKILLLGLYAIVTFTAGTCLGYNSQQFKLLAWLCVNQALNSLILYLRSNFEGLMLFRWDSILSVMDRLIMIAICGMLLAIPSTHAAFSIEWFVYAQTAAYVVTVVAAFAALLRHAELKKLKWNRLFSLAILRKSLPFALLTLLMATYNRIDPVLLQILSPDGNGNLNAGIYAGAFRLLDALTMIAYLVSIPLLPVYSRLTRQHELGSDNTDIRSTTAMVFAMMMVFAVTAACALSSQAESIMQLFYRDSANDYAGVFQILIFSIIPISITYVFGTLLTAGGLLKQLNKYALATLIINVMVNIILIPRIGVRGSAWASITAQSVMAAAQLMASIKKYQLKPSKSYVMRLFSFVFVEVAVCRATTSLQPVVALAVITVVSVASSILLGLINIKSIAQLLAKR